MALMDDEVKRLLAERYASGQGLPSGGVDYLMSPFERALGPGAARPRFQEIERIRARNPNDRPALLANFNAFSETQYEWDENGFLRRVEGSAPKDGKPRSALYSEAIDAAIASDKIGDFEIDPEYRRPPEGGSIRRSGSVDDERGGGVTAFDDFQYTTNTKLSGREARIPVPGGETLPMSPEEVQLHELAAHVSPFLRAFNRVPPGEHRAQFETPPGVSAHDINGGSAIPYENRMRAELALPPRPVDPRHGFLKRLNPPAVAAPPRPASRRSR